MRRCLEPSPEQCDLAWRFQSANESVIGRYLYSTTAPAPVRPFPASHVALQGRSSVQMAPTLPAAYWAQAESLVHQEGLPAEAVAVLLAAWWPLAAVEVAARRPVRP